MLSAAFLALGAAIFALGVLIPVLVAAIPAFGTAISVVAALVKFPPMCNRVLTILIWIFLKL